MSIGFRLPYLLNESIFSCFTEWVFLFLVNEFLGWHANVEKQTRGVAMAPIVLSF